MRLFPIICFNFNVIYVFPSVVNFYITRFYRNPFIISFCLNIKDSWPCHEISILSGEIETRAPIVNAALQGNATAETPDIEDNSNRIATTSFVKANLAEGSNFKIILSQETPSAGEINSGDFWFKII